MLTRTRFGLVIGPFGMLANGNFKEHTYIENTCTLNFIYWAYFINAR